jgi:hypothetical protein
VGGPPWPPAIHTFFKKATESLIMKISQETVDEILSVHDSLWEAVYSTDDPTLTLNYKGATYTIQIPHHRGYASVMLPNAKGSKFMWITQNLRKPTYGTMAIDRAKKDGEDHRMSWIVDTSNGGFTYRAYISTTKNLASELIAGHIEIYDSLGREIVWSHNQALVTRKAEF